MAQQTFYNGDRVRVIDIRSDKFDAVGTIVDIRKRAVDTVFDVTFQRVVRDVGYPRIITVRDSFTRDQLTLRDPEPDHRRD